MKRKEAIVLVAVLVWALLGLLHCGPPRVCAPGKSESCACPGGNTGAQTCKADGAGYEPCSCGTPKQDGPGTQEQPTAPDEPSQPTEKDAVEHPSEGSDAGQEPISDKGAQKEPEPQTDVSSDTPPRDTTPEASQEKPTEASSEMTQERTAEASPDTSAREQSPEQSLETIPEQQGGCATGLTDCSGACVDRQSDRTHCGTCAQSCAAAQGCSKGQCVTPTTWAKSAGGTRQNEYGQDVVIDDNGNAYVIGTFSSNPTNFGPFKLQLTAPGAGRDIFIAKLDIAGNFLWVAQVSSSESLSGTGITLDPQNNIIIVGSSNGATQLGSFSLTSQKPMGFVAKLAPNGTFLWATPFKTSDTSNPKAVATDKQGNILTTGNFQGTASFGSTTLTATGQSALFFAQLTPKGTFVWAKKTAGFPEGLTVDSKGNLLVTGSFSGTVVFGSTTLTHPANDITMFVAKLDNKGTFLWAKQMTGAGSHVGNAVVVDSKDNAYVVGSFSQGNTSPTTVKFGSLSLTSSSSQGRDGFIAKLDGQGQYIWVTGIGSCTKQVGCEDDRLSDIAIDNKDHLTITGHTLRGVIIGNTTLQTQSETTFVARLDDKGSFLWARQATNGINSPHGIAVGPFGQAYVTGTYRGTATFGSTSLTSTGAYDLFIWRLPP